MRTAWPLYIFAKITDYQCTEKMAYLLLRTEAGSVWPDFPVIATPVAWYAMNKWLKDYTYRVTLSWSIFFIAGLLAIVIALITVSFQSIKAAISNPVKSLRIE